MKAIAAATAFMILAFGSGNAAAARAAVDSEIAEAVFRYQFAHNESMQQSAASVFCVGYKLENQNWEDPPADVIARLNVLKSRVVPASQCPCFLDNSKASWIIFRINAVKCASDTSCEAEGGYYENAESASGNTYYLEKQNGHWTVTRDEMHWIS